LKETLREALVDTSVWIDFFNGKVNPETNFLTALLEEDSEIFTCPLIIQEILQGIKSDKEHDILKEKLFSLNILSIDPIEAALGASDLYRELRKKGITIRKTNDIQIAFYCIYYNIPVLHKDRDFRLISKHSDLKLY